MVIVAMLALVVSPPASPSACLVDKVRTYDVYYRVTKRIALGVETKTGSDGKSVREPYLIADPNLIRTTLCDFRMVKCGATLRCEEFVDGALASVSVLHDGVITSYTPGNQTYAVNDKALALAPPHCSYEDYRFGYEGRLGMGLVYALRSDEGLASERIEGGNVVMTLMPGKSRVVEMADKVVAKYSLDHGLSLGELTRFAQPGDAIRERRLIARMHRVSDDTFVPVSGRIDTFWTREGHLYGKKINVYELSVDMERSRWNHELEERDVQRVEIAAGAQVIDKINERTYIVGQKPMSNHLDELAKNAMNVVDTKPSLASTDNSLWYVGGGVAMVVVVVAVLQYLIRRR